SGPKCGRNMSPAQKGAASSAGSRGRRRWSAGRTEITWILYSLFWIPGPDIGWSAVWPQSFFVVFRRERVHTLDTGHANLNPFVPSPSPPASSPPPPSSPLLNPAARTPDRYGPGYYNAANRRRSSTPRRKAGTGTTPWPPFPGLKGRGAG